jgi:GT2 family glycosyltransferase
MLVSIIIVNWNTRVLLKECLESVVHGIQSVEAEIIVVDNASSDGSLEMVEKEFPQAILIKNSENRGFAAANNQALKAAKGAYVLLLNSDTVVHGDVIAHSVAYMDAKPEVGVMGCRVLNTDGTVQATCSQFPSLLNLALLTSGVWKLPGPSFFDRYQMRRWRREEERDVQVVSGCYMLVRAEALKDVGLLDENFFFFGEETDWCKRFGDAGWALRFAPVGVITHHGGGSAKNLSYRRDLMLSSAIVKLHLKHFGFVSGVAAWSIISCFNISRAAFWAAYGSLSWAPSVRERRKHFALLSRNLLKAWPSDRTYSGD